MRTVYETTDLVGLHPLFGPLIRELDALWLDIVGHELYILHALDGKHSRFSRHYQGCAIDVRTWIDPTVKPAEAVQITGAERIALTSEVQRVLGKNFRLIDHFNSAGDHTHYHISFKPEDEKWTAE